MSEIVNCPRCGTANQAGQYHCSSCKLNLSVKYTPAPGETPAFPIEPRTPVAIDESPEMSTEGQRRIASVLLARNRDAYRQANSIVSTGAVVKTVGWILAALIVVGGLMTKNGEIIAGSIVVALATGSSFNSKGVGIAAQGQLMLASLDTAVNTSPFLEDGQKAQILA